QGNFTLMTDDLPSVIRGFAKKIFFVHFRDVKAKPERFEETWHDAGKTDMLACMRTYRDIGFNGVLRPDHVPTVEGDSNDNAGYSAFGRLYAIGYIRGLRQAVYAEWTSDEGSPHRGQRRHRTGHRCRASPPRRQRRQYRPQAAGRNCRASRA